MAVLPTNQAHTNTDTDCDDENEDENEDDSTDDEDNETDDDTEDQTDSENEHDDLSSDDDDDDLDIDDIQTINEYLNLYPKIQSLIGTDNDRLERAFVTWRESDPTNDTWGITTPPTISRKYWTMHQTWLPQHHDSAWFRLRQDEKVDKNKALLSEWLNKTIFKHNKNTTITIFDYESFQMKSDEEPPVITTPADIEKYASDDLGLIFHGMEFSKFRKGHPIRFIVGHDEPYERFEKTWKSDYGIYPCNCTASDPVTLGWFLYSHPTYDNKALERFFWEKAGIRIALRTRPISILAVVLAEKEIEYDRTVKATHVEVSQKDARHIKSILGSTY